VKRTAIMMFCSLVLFGCASRPATIGTDANYVIEVTNPMPHAMNVSLDMGAGQMAALGEVQPGQTKQFKVSNPSSNDVIIKAIDQGNSHTVEKHVELERGTVAKVLLKD
jgi:P pilus assembly chaperone PapD